MIRTTWKSATGTLLPAALAMLVVASPVHAKESATKRHAKIDATATRVLDEVMKKSSNANELYEKSVGYAVFDNIKLAFGVSGGGGSGVAISKAGKRTYMKMATAGVGFGLGGQKYQVLFLFETEEAFDQFVDKGWQAGASAQAAAADKGANLGASFHNGIAYYQLTDKGLIASADLSGTKYWKSDNEE